jgi:hypothetical protein
MPDDAREGFELAVRTIRGLDKDELTADVFEDLEKEFSDEEQKLGDAFNDYIEETCDMDGLVPEASGAPSLDPSDLPSLDPSDLPSFDPSDLESEFSDLESMLSDMPTDFPTE